MHSSVLGALIISSVVNISNVDPASLRIRAGVYDINNDSSEGFPHQERTVKQITVHGNFSHKALYNDIALLSIGEPFHYDYHVGPICAPFERTIYKSPDSFDPQRCLVTGWGRNNLGKMRQLCKHSNTCNNCIRFPILQSKTELFQKS